MISVILLLLLLSYTFNYFAIRFILQNENENVYLEWPSSIKNDLFLSLVTFLMPIMGTVYCCMDLYALFEDKWIKSNKDKIIKKIFFLKEDKEL